MSPFIGSALFGGSGPRRLAFMAACLLAFITGCASGMRPISRVGVPDPTAVPPSELIERYNRARAAYDAGEIARFVEITAALTEAWPDHPLLIYDLARGQALEGHSGAAMDLLDRLVRMRVAIDITENEDLRSLHGLPRFTALVDRYEAALAPTITGEVALRLDDPEFVPEDVAWDPVSGDLFLSSIRKRKIVRIDDQGMQTRFAGYPEIDMLAALSMAVDAKRRRLWLTTATTPSMIDYRAEVDEGRSELLGFDLDSGDLLVRVAAPAEGDRHELNDLAVEADGALLVGDAPVGAIYRLPPGSRSFETVAGPGAMLSPQGIVILPDGGPVLVADYSRGLCRLGSHGEVKVLRSPEDEWLGGIDGLSLHGRRELIAVQSGITPSRVVRIWLNEKADGVVKVDVLDLAHPEHDQPTLGEVVGNEFLYVANSLWGAWDREGNPVEGRKLRPPVILRISLE